jgi:hypothetical protein
MLVDSFSDDQDLFELIEDMIREVRSDVKPVLEFEAKHKLHSLEFDIFIPIPNIVRKKVTRYVESMPLFYYLSNSRVARNCGFES